MLFHSKPSRNNDSLPADVKIAHLRTPPVPRFVPDGVFDDYGWCASDTLEWRRPAATWDPSPALDGSDPRRMVFVLRQPCDFLPTELARLHAFGLGLRNELALAPWGIDSATDGLYEHRVPPSSVLWLAADNLNALFWGLHDWAHFHHHGPFEERAWTELQCDAVALRWLWINRAACGLDDAAHRELRLCALRLSLARFGSEGRPVPPIEAYLQAAYVDAALFQ